MTRQHFRLQGMHCVGCAMSIDGALEDLAGVKSANTSYARQVVEVEYDERQIEVRQLIAAIESVGYRATLPSEPQKSS
jgi:copper chaperone CopZ